MRRPVRRDTCTSENSVLLHSDGSDEEEFAPGKRHEDVGSVGSGAERITPTKAILSGSAAGIGTDRDGKPKHEVRAVEFLANFVLERPSLLFKHRAAHYRPLACASRQRPFFLVLRPENVDREPPGDGPVRPWGPGDIGEELNRFSASFGGREIQFDFLHHVIVALSHVNDGKN